MTRRYRLCRLTPRRLPPAGSAVRRAFFLAHALAALSASATASTDISFTGEQVARGESVYREHCQICHGSSLSNGQFGTPLKGGFFQLTWSGKSLGELLAFTRESMPPEQAGKLTPGAYTDVLAYVLSSNGLPAGDRALGDNAEALRDVPLPW